MFPRVGARAVRIAVGFRIWLSADMQDNIKHGSGWTTVEKVGSEVLYAHLYECIVIDYLD